MVVVVDMDERGDGLGLGGGEREGLMSGYHEDQTYTSGGEDGVCDAGGLSVDSNDEEYARGRRERSRSRMR